GDSQRFVERQRAFADPVSKRGSIDQLENKVVRADIVNLADIGMIQRGDGANLALEPVAEALGRYLDCHFATHPRIACTVDLAHAACAEWRDDLVRAEPGAGSERHRNQSSDSTPTAHPGKPARATAGICQREK